MNLTDTALKMNEVLEGFKSGRIHRAFVACYSFRVIPCSLVSEVQKWAEFVIF
jgi:hypothetical protein